MKLQVGVKIFLENNEGKFLLMQRNTEKYATVKGTWDIVGGRIDPGDTLLENLKREVFEETQLEIIGTPKLLYAQDIIPNEEKHVVRLTYIGKTEGEPVLDTSENVAYRWCTLEEIREIDDVDIYVTELLNLEII